MRAYNLQKQITTGKSALPVAILISVILWVVTFFLVPELPYKESTYPFWQIARSYFPEWLDRIACLVIFSFIGYFLIGMNNQFTFIQARVTLQTSLFFLLVSVFPCAHLLYAGDVATLAYLIAVYFLFRTYQQSRSSGNLFISALFVGLGSLVYPQITFFLIIILIGALNFQSLNTRGFFAMIIGWALPYWFLLAYAFCFDQMFLFYQPFIELATFYPIDLNGFEWWELATFGYAFLLCLVASIHSFVNSYRDKIRARAYLRFFILLNTAIYIYIIVQPEQSMNMLSLLLAGTGILAGHLFVLSRSKAANWFFIISLTGLFILYGFNIWMLL